MLYATYVSMVQSNQCASAGLQILSSEYWNRHHALACK